MPFDQSTRNRLQRFVSDARTLLTEEFSRQLQHVYGLDPDTGEVTDISRLPQLDDARRETCRLLRDTLEHYLAASPSGGPKESLQRIVREQAFTVLNRFARSAWPKNAAAGGIRRAGATSRRAFSVFEPGRVRAGRDGRCLPLLPVQPVRRVGRGPRVLFDRFAQGLLFPREPPCCSCSTCSTHADLEPLWAEDETIGWIYQYFNDQAERKKMRDESAAPRNSRELAVRNQFFTPRYVVEFLTDNTLGRIWYEMTQGQTRLKEQCRYLVRRPTEIFLEPRRSRARETQPTDQDQDNSPRKNCSSSPSTSRIARSKTRARSGCSIPPAARCTSASTPSTCSRSSTRKPGTWSKPARTLRAVRPRTTATARHLCRQGRLPAGRAPPHHRAQHPRHRHRPARRPDRRPFPLAAGAEGVAGSRASSRQRPADQPLEHRLRRADAGREGAVARVRRAASSRLAERAVCLASLLEARLRQDAAGGRGRLAAQDRGRDPQRRSPRRRQPLESHAAKPNNWPLFDAGPSASRSRQELAPRSSPASPTRQFWEKAEETDLRRAPRPTPSRPKTAAATSAGSSPKTPPGASPSSTSAANVTTWRS